MLIVAAWIISYSKLSYVPNELELFHSLPASHWLFINNSLTYFIPNLNKYHVKELQDETDDEQINSFKIKDFSEMAEKNTSLFFLFLIEKVPSQW